MTTEDPLVSWAEKHHTLAASVVLLRSLLCD